MKKNNFVMLCLRLLGIYFAVIGLGSVSNALSILFDFNSAPIYVFFGSVISIISGIILFVFAPKLSSYIIQFSNAEEGNIHITTSEKTARIAFLVLGIYIFTYALAELVPILIDTVLYYKMASQVPDYIRDTKPRWTYLFSPIIRLIIAATLIIGPDKIFAFVSRYDVTLKNIREEQK